MSFGYSVGDAVLLTRLAWEIVQNSRKACGEHDELTREVLSLHIVLQRLKHEYSKADSPLNRSSDTCNKQLQVIARGCERVLWVLDTILKKYNRLSGEDKSWRKLWQKITFGNGQVADIQALRSKIVNYTSAMSLFLDMVALGSLGRIEQQMSEGGGDLQEIKVAVHDIAAHMTSKCHDQGSVLTSYTNDDKAVWKEFRRELRREGFASSNLKRHKSLIVAYIKELGDRGLFDDNYSGDVKSVEEWEGRNSHSAPDGLLAKNRRKSSSTDQALSTAESTSAVLHRDHPVTRSGRQLSLDSYDISNADTIFGDVPDARLTIKSIIDDISEQYLARNPRTSSASEAPTVDSKGVEATDVHLELEKKSLQSYPDSVAEGSMEQFDDTESSLGSQTTPVNVPYTTTPPTSHGGPSIGPTESIQTNHSANISLATRSPRSISRGLSTESTDLETVKHKRHGIGANISTFYVASNGLCLAWDDLDASSLLDQFEDRVHIIIDCQRLTRCFWENFRGRLNQFVETANVIISNINDFLAAVGPYLGSCKCDSMLADFTSQPFKAGILSLSPDSSAELDDLRDILLNVCLWVRRFDDNCGGIVFYFKKHLTSRNSLALQHPRNLELRKCWSTPNCLRPSTGSMEGTYQRPSYFHLRNEGPTSPGLLREIRCLVKENPLQSSVRRNECRKRIGRYTKALQHSESGGTGLSSDTIRKDIAPATKYRMWKRCFYACWCRDVHLNLQPWIDFWCAGDPWRAWVAVDAIWHNYYEKIAPACIAWIKVHGNPIDLEKYENRIRRSLMLLSISHDYGNEEVMERIEILRGDLSFMLQALEDVGKGEKVGILDVRSRENRGKRVWLDRRFSIPTSVPVIRVHTGEGCEACDQAKKRIFETALQT